MDTSFLKNLDEISKEEKQEFAIEEALSHIEVINDKMKTINQKATEAINLRLATGNCYIKDDILFERRKDGDKAIWFPKGNAVEYQVKRGIMPQSFLDSKNKLQNLIDKRDKPDESEVT